MEWNYDMKAKKVYIPNNATTDAFSIYMLKAIDSHSILYEILAMKCLKG